MVEKIKPGTKIGIKARCTWGDGPDVLLTLDGRELLLYAAPRMPGPDNIMNPIDGSKTNFGKKLAEKFIHHGYVNEGSLCLTAMEARFLAVQLNFAAEEAEWAMSMCGVKEV